MPGVSHPAGVGRARAAETDRRLPAGRNRRTAAFPRGCPLSYPLFPTRRGTPSSRRRENSTVAAKRSFESEALQHTYDRSIAGDPALDSFYDQALFDTEVASMIYDLRTKAGLRSEEHTSELQSLRHLVCRLLLEKKTI